MVVKVTCAHCGASIEKNGREYRRSTRLGRRFFCDLSCCAATSNAPRKAQQIERACPCGVRFFTAAKAKSPDHCSSSCASRFSMNEARRAAQSAAGSASQNLASQADVLRTRESWKYVELRRALGDRPHVFEYELSGHVFNLALLDVRTVVEFDGPYHRGPQLDIDARKDEAARAVGFHVVRRSVPASSVINPATIVGL